MDEMKVVYLSHPLTTFGDFDVNMKKVYVIARELGKIKPNWCLVSPLHNFSWMEKNTPHGKMMIYCLRLLETCDSIVLCPGWRGSVGCNAEKISAESQKMDIYFFENGEIKQWRNRYDIFHR